MIVRDEEAMLPGLLESVAGLWDEFVAVDSGSRDETVPLLEAAGARVVPFVWCDDFAAARNAALAAATGDWILALDADERVSPELAASIRVLLDDPDAGAATVLLRDELPHGHVHECRLLRLFRRDPAIRFEHAIHEDASRTVADVLQRDGRTTRELDGVLRHLGYTRDVAAARDKKNRDVTLLRRCLAADPRDWYSRYKLLEQARFWNDAPLWRREARTAASQLDRAGPRALDGFRFAGDLIVHIGRGMADGAGRELNWLDRWAPAASGAAEYWLRRGEVLESLGRTDAAADAYRACRERGAAAAPQNSTVRPLMGLSRLAASRGDLREALALAESALEHAPRDPEALLAAIAFAHLVRDADGLASRYRHRHGNPPQWHEAVGDHALARGDWTAARAALSRAAGTPPRAAAAVKLAQARLACGDVAGARSLAASLMAELPVAALGVVVCDLIAGRDLDLEVDLEPEAADAALRAWIDLLWRSRRLDLMGSFADRCEALAESFPWLPEHLRMATLALSSV
ncbi:MAG: glycosyltransferase [Candidatus Latescibacteria bacterium]|nr:glycosyltransferase [Candidatus Latescibacterota bacterium]